MHPEIQQKIDELHAALIAHAPSNAVCFRLFVNYEEVQSELTTRTPDQLKQSGVSMRSITGAWIL